MYKLNKVLFCLHCFLFISLNPFESVGTFMSHRKMRYVFQDLYAPLPYPIAVLSCCFLIRLKINDPINTGASMEARMVVFLRTCFNISWLQCMYLCVVTNGTPQYLQIHTETRIMMLCAMFVTMSQETFLSDSCEVCDSILSWTQYHTY